VTYERRGRGYGFTVGPYDRRLPLVIDPLLQSTYLGGTGVDVARALAVHPTTGEIYVAGSSGSSDFPGTVGGAQALIRGGSDAFIARLNSGLTALTQATYLGGSGGDGAFALAVHPTTGDIYVAGVTSSTDFPGTVGGAQPAFGGGFLDIFIARLPSSLTALTQATYLGGSGDESVASPAIAIHSTTGDVYVTGGTSSIDFPGTAGGAQPAFGGGRSDAFIARLSASLTLLIQATYLGGSGDDQVDSAIAIHPATGDVYVSGRTTSTQFPGTRGGGSGGEQAYALMINPKTNDIYVAGGTSSSDFPNTAGGVQPQASASSDAFIARLAADLTVIIQATYLGGRGYDEASALAINVTNNNVYVAGGTSSPDFPGTSGGAQPVFRDGCDRFQPLQCDAFIARLTSSLALMDAVPTVPTLSEWAQILLLVLLVASGVLTLRRRRVAG